MPPLFQPTTLPTGSIGTSASDHWLRLISKQAGRLPGKPAVIHGTSTLSFGELEIRSDRIARTLHDSGIGPGCYVGSCFNRSSDLLVSLLGILKSGAAYIPLDPSYPQDRIAQMLSSANLKTVVTTRALANQFPGTNVFFADQETSASDSNRPITRFPTAQDPVYAIFTSGSTGRPKAASVRHSGFSNLLDWYTHELQLGPDDRTLVISSPSFDLTQKNLFAPLLTGGTLILDESPTYDIPRILQLIRNKAVTLINCTPSVFLPLMDAAQSDGFAALASLRHVVLGGEPIPAPRLRKWLKHPQCNAEIVNSYGPTECTDICLFHRLNRHNLDAFPFVPLGTAIPNVRVSIRDEKLSPLPAGETGELCISGVGLGGGYLHDADRTAECFVTSSEPFYRTGDLAKRHPCDTFEFRGRTDQQIKLNGFRIEPGEIEIALNQHPGVHESVVTASHNRLTAHIRGSATADELRTHLSTRLPAHMIPTAFVSVSEFPLIPNGKIDRRKLTETRQTEPPDSSPGLDNNLETEILKLWSEILGHPVTDATASFFDLGGNSIQIAIVHARLREMTAREFPITDLFALPSARSIANHLSPQTTEPAPTTARQRAIRARAGFAQFQRPINR